MHTIIRHFLLLSAISGALFSASAEAPAGYYKSLNGKKGAELKSAVAAIISNQLEVTNYSSYYNALSTTFQKTDLYPGTRQWWDMYSDIPFYAPSFKGLNREHSFPKSWWGGSTEIPAYIDLNHLYPSEAAANQAKSNYPLGEVSSADFNNGVCKVGYPVSGQGGGARFVFEPSDEYKGDFARTYFYMATRYSSITWKYTYMVTTGEYPTLNTWSQKMLLKWHEADQVSQKELDRNDAVYQIQNNRNPFIDLPTLAEHIWGDKRDEPFNAEISTTPAGDPTLITPTQNMELEFGETAIGSTSTQRLFFKGENLTGSLSLMLRNNDSKYFSISDTRISSVHVNREQGYWVNVTYTPLEPGEHTARLVVLDGGIEGSVGVGLRGQAFPVPSLSALTATNPSDITSDSYVANWNPAPENETVDYYIVTRTIYNRGTSETEELIAEDSNLKITDFDKSESESYSVQSVRLGYKSPMSNVVFVSHAGITGVDTDKPMTAIVYPGGIRFETTTEQYNCRIYDSLGRIIRDIPTIYNNFEISLPLGVYFITSDTMRTPLRIVVK